MSHQTAAPQDWLDADPRKEEAWKPSVGEQVVGTILDIDVRQVEWKDQRRSVVVLILDTGDEESVTTVWCLHTVLANEVRKLAPQIGDQIGIVRLADSEQGYKRYRVASPDAKKRGFNWRDAPTDQGDVAPEHRPQFYDSPPAPSGDTRLPFEADDEDDEELDFLTARK